MLLIRVCWKEINQERMKRSNEKKNLDICALKCLKLPVIKFMQQGTQHGETLSKKLLKGSALWQRSNKHVLLLSQPASCQDPLVVYCTLEAESRGRRKAANNFWLALML